MSRINTPESDSVFELWPLNVSTLQYLSMYFTFFKFLYRLNYMAYKAELDICDAQFGLGEGPPKKGPPTPPNLA